MRVESVSLSSWLVWALGSAGFTALTAIFATIGVEGTRIDDDRGSGTLEAHRPGADIASRHSGGRLDAILGG